MMFNKSIIKLVIIIYVFAFLLPNSYAATWDNVKDYDPNPDPYGSVTVTNWLGLGSDIAKYTLIENTENCLIDCHAKGYAELYDDTVLFNNLNFLNPLDKESWLDEYHVYLVNKYEDTVTEDITIPNCTTEYVETLMNGSEFYNTYCNPYTEQFTKTVTKEDKTEYTLGTVLPAGSYEWLIVGKKRPNQRVDWQPLSNGVKLDEWAWWQTNATGRITVNITNNLGFKPNLTYRIKVDTSDFVNNYFLVTNKSGTVVKAVNLSGFSNETEFLLDLVELGQGVNEYYIWDMPDPQATYNMEDFGSVLWADSGVGVSNGAGVAGNKGWAIADAKQDMVYNGTLGRLTNTSIYSDYALSEERLIKTISLQSNVTVCDWVYISSLGNPTEMWMMATDNYHRIMDVAGLSTQNVSYHITSDIVSDVPIGAKDAWHEVCVYVNSTGEHFYYDNNLVVKNAGQTSISKIYINNYNSYKTGYADFFVSKHYGDQNPSYVYSSYSTENPIIVTLYEPKNNTYFNTTNILFKCNAYTTNIYIGYINLSIDGIINYTLTNGTAANVTLEHAVNNIADGQHNWSCTAIDDSARSNTDTRTFTVDTVLPLFSNILYQNHSAKTLQPIDINYTVNDDNLNTTWAVLSNGTHVDATGSYPNYTVTFTPAWGVNNLTLYATDLAGNSNRTNVTLYYYHSPELINLTHTINLTPLYYQYVLNISGNIYDFDTGLNGITLIVNLNDTGYMSVAWNNSTKVINFSQVKKGKISVNATITMLDDHGSNDYSVILNVDNLSVQPCSPGDPGYGIVYNVSTWLEQNDTYYDQTSSVSYSLLIWETDKASNLTYSAVNSTVNGQFYVCLKNTSGLNYYVDSIFEYLSSGYSKRWLHGVMEEANSTIEKKLYLLDTGSTSYIDIYTYDLQDTAYPGRYVYLDRYYLATDQFETVASTVTDDDGHGVIPLEKTVTDYRFRVYNYDEVEYSSDKRKITSDSVILRIIGVTFSTFLEGFESLATNIDYDDSAGEVVATYSGSDGSYNICLNLFSILSPTNYGIVCENCSKTYADTLTCKVANTTGAEYYATLTAKVNPTAVLDTLKIVLDKAAMIKDYIGNNAPIIAFVLLGTIMATAVFSPAAALIMTVVGLIAVSLLGLVSITAGSIIMFAVIVILIITRLKV